MVCIICGHETHVINSRHQKRANNIWRRRQCLQCGSVMTSIERFSYSQHLRYQKQRGPLEAFQEDELFISIRESLAHTANPTLAARELTNTIIGKLLSPSGRSLVIKRNELVELTASVLKNYDTAAYVRYTAFYQPGTVR